MTHPTSHPNGEQAGDNDQQKARVEPTGDQRAPTPSHTPGPWFADGPKSNIHVVEEARPHMRICFMTSDGNARANARLIAAAPDLLAVLLAVNHTLHTHGKTDASTPLHLRIEAAITKAQGHKS